MSRRTSEQVAAASCLALILGLLVMTPAGGRAPTPMRQVDRFEPVVVVEPIAVVETLGPIVDFPVGHSFEPVPVTAQPTAATEPMATPKPSPRGIAPPKPKAAVSSGHAVSGVATWYCLPGRSVCPYVHPTGGMYAAAGPAIRIGHWRGRYVTVCAGKCIRVQLVDWCACGGGHIIDLFADAFRQFHPLSTGGFRVTVKW